MARGRHSCQIVAILVSLSLQACFAAKKKEDATLGLIELDEANFLGTVTELALEYDWVLIEFYSHWCPACKAFQPDYKKVATHVFNVMGEEEKAWKGKLDGKPATLAVGRVDCPENSRLCDDFGITSYPTMFLDSPVHFSTKTKDNIREVKPRRRNFNGVISALEKLLDRDLKGSVVPEPKDDQGEVSVDGEHVHQESDIILPKPEDDTKVTVYPKHADRGDIIGATVLSFEYLGSSALLKGPDARKALSRWLHLLASSHPVKECAMGADAALVSLNKVWDKSSQEIQDLDMFRRLKICGGLTRGPWNQCAGSTSESRGYTCGLWMLFHSLSVRMPEKNGSRSGQEWLDVIRGFVQHFFQCGDCAKHFLEYAGKSDARDVDTKRDGVLWLWRTHNLVNDRLSREQDSVGKGDPLFPHQQWPSKEHCRNCIVDTDYFEDNVYKFLFKYYNGTTVTMVDSTLSAVYKKKGASTEAGTSWSFAFIIVALVTAIVYIMLGRSSQYSVLRKKGRK